VETLHGKRGVSPPTCSRTCNACCRPHKQHGKVDLGAPQSLCHKLLAHTPHHNTYFRPPQASHTPMNMFVSHS